MGIDSNKDVVRRMVEECVNTDRVELLDRFVHADVRIHPGTPGTAPDTEGINQLRQAFTLFRTVFPDLHHLGGPHRRRRSRGGALDGDRHPLR